MLARLFPLPIIPYWLYIRKKYSVKNDEPGAELREEIILNKTTKEILKALDGPFRNLQGTDNNHNYRLPWESILLGGRFVLIVLKTLLIDTIVGPTLMLLFTIFCLVHHSYIRPFANNLLNLAETLSLFMLACICILNILPSFVYYSPIYVSSYIEDFIQEFQGIETKLMLVFPFIIGCWVGILVGVTILELTFSLVKAFLSLMRHLKRKIANRSL